MKQLEIRSTIIVNEKRLTVRELISLRSRVIEVLKHTKHLTFDFSGVEYIDSCMVTFFLNLTKQARIRINNVNQDVLDIFKYCNADSIIQF